MSYFEVRIKDVKNIKTWHKPGSESLCYRCCITNVVRNSYQDILVFAEIPEKFRDVFFYHEVVEAIHMDKGITQAKAHELARTADLEYRNKHLSVKEQREFILTEQNLLEN